MPEAISGAMGWGVAIGVIFLLGLFVFLYFLHRKPKRGYSRPVETWPPVERRQNRPFRDSSSGRNYASPLNRDRQTGHENEDMAMIGSLASLASDASDARPHRVPNQDVHHIEDGFSSPGGGFRTGGSFGGEGFSTGDSGGGDSGGSSGGGDSGGSND